MENIRNYALQIIDKSEEALGTNKGLHKIVTINAARDEIILSRNK